MKKVKEEGASLPLDFEPSNDRRSIFTDQHIELLRHSWSKLEKSKHELYMFNRDLHKKIFKMDSLAFLEHVAKANIKHLSEWAQEEITSRE